MASELLQQVRVIDPVTQTDRIADLLITDGMIRAIADSLSDYPTDTSVRDCRGLIAAPGLVDLYSQSGEPGFEARETLESLLQAASVGGFTRIAILPGTQPAIDTPAMVAWIKNRHQTLQRSLHLASNTPLPHLYCWAALTQETQGQQMTELAELATTEIVGFADGRSLNHPALIRRLLEYGQPLNKPIALWACDPTLVGNGVMREGYESIIFGLPGIPSFAETAPLAALLEYIATIQTPVHIMRVSTARSVELIQAAKAQGAPITASTTWMHLLLNSQAVGSYDPHLRLAPPLGNPADQQALQQAVQAGILDAIAIDHTPYSYEEKTVAFAEAPTGAIGLELALPLLWQTLVASGQWSALELWQALSTRPAACLQQAPPMIDLNQPAELILFDPHHPWTVESTSLRSRSTNTPWLGQTIPGRVVNRWIGRQEG
ncbi:dihydroorotase [Pantanalinema rosaneae CENA516]|uniref:dihydroorotase n=1 Tax=Pantanalinema rosaneae TaxID=1620701 RepID=UPI003D6FC30C